MPDLYAELGVDRDAHPDTIHAAYRRRAKTVHPDGGGTPEAFERLQLAHSVLSDLERRRRYDETGSYDNTPADNADADALSVIGQMLLQLLNGEQEPAQLDLRKELLVEMKAALQAVEKSVKSNSRMKARAERLLGRFKTKAGEPTPVETMLNMQVARCDQAKAKHEQATRAFTRAIEIVEGWTFEREKSLGSQQMYSSALNQYASQHAGSAYAQAGMFGRRSF